MYTTEQAVEHYIEGHTLVETVAHTGLSLHEVRKAVIAADAMRKRNESRRQRNAARTHRRCPRCREMKPLEDFHVRRYSSGTLGPCGYCKPCQHLVNQVYRYGLTTDEYEEMREAQGGRCAICQQVKKLGIDHDHETGAVRKLLCTHCNQGLGRFMDDPELLLKAAAYLAQQKGGQ